MTFSSPPLPPNRFVDKDGRLDKFAYNFLISLWQRTGGNVNIVSQVTEPGIIVNFAGTTPPLGWLVCDGSEVTVAQYPNLYAVIGNTYPGSFISGTTFRLPDARGRSLIGSGTAGGGIINHSVGSTIGSETRTLAQSNLPNYNLAITDTGHIHTAATTTTTPNHSHTFTGTPHTHVADEHNHSINDPAHTHIANPHSHGVSNDFVTNGAGTEYINLAGDKGIAALNTDSTTSTNQSATTGITINNTVVTLQNTTASGSISSESLSNTSTTIISSASTGIAVNTGGSGTPFQVFQPTLVIGGAIIRY